MSLKRRNQNRVQKEEEAWNFNEIKRRLTLLESETVLGAPRNKYEHNLNMKNKNAN